MKRINHPFGSARKDKFCWKCKTITCCNHNHPRVSISYRVRVPKKNCNSYQWKQFCEYMANYPYVVKQLRDFWINDLDIILKEKYKINPEEYTKHLN